MKPTLTEDLKSVSFPALKVRQPIGEFYVSVLSSKILCDITEFDVRRIFKERDFETYLGIQRPLNEKRVKEIERYITTIDACFPTAVVLSVTGVCARHEEEKGVLTLSNYIDTENPERNVLYREIAKVIDGQHRIEALKAFRGDEFDVNVCIFVDIDVAQEGYIFSTVNLTGKRR